MKIIKVNIVAKLQHVTLLTIYYYYYLEEEGMYHRSMSLL